MTEQFVFNSLDEVDALANRLSLFCPEPKLAFIGLKELLINAIEHGCLGITYQEKTQLLKDGHDYWENEVARRTALLENARKKVLVQVEIATDEIRFLIKDPGTGFDWNPFLHIDPQRHAVQHGRGIAIARQMSFHHLEFRGVGNEVLAVVRMVSPAQDGSTSET